MGTESKGCDWMREVVFHVLAERPGHLEAQAETLPLRITAPTLEDLQHEAREALITHLGPAHCAVRVRVRRRHGIAMAHAGEAAADGQSHQPACRAPGMRIHS